MAIKNEDLVVAIKIQGGKNAEKELEGVEGAVKDLQKTIAKNDSSFAGFFDTFVKANLGLFSFAQNLKLGVAATQDFFKGFIEGDDAMTRFNLALAQTGGQGTEALRKSVVGVSKEMQRLGIAEDDQVTSLSAVAVAAGATAEQITDMAKAAAGISVIKPNVSFAEAFNALQKSLKGTVGPLALLAPELKDLTAESAKAGDGISYLVDKYGPYAQKNLDTFTGKLKAANFAFDEAKDEVAETIAKFLGLPAVLEGAADSFRNVTKGVQELNALLRTDEAKVFAGSMAVATASVVAFNLATDAIGLKIVTANLLAAGKAALIFSKNLAVFIGVAAGIATVAASVDVIMKNFHQLSEILKGLGGATMDAIILGFNKMLTIGMKIIQDVITPFKGLPVVGEFFKANEKNLVTLEKAAVKTGASLDKNLSRALEGVATIDTGLFGKASDFIRGLGDSSEEMAKLGDAAGKTGKQIQLLSDDAIRAMEELKNKLKEAQKSAASAGLEGVAKITAEAKAAQIEITNLGAIIKKGANGGIIPKEALENMSKLRTLTATAYDRQVVEAFRKSQEDLMKTTLGLQLQLVQQTGTQQEIIAATVQAQYDLVDAKERELSVQRLLDGAAKDQLDKQRALIDAAGKAASAKAPGQEFGQVQKAGDGIANSIKGALTSGVAGLVTGGLAVADSFADAIKGLIDFLPNFINKMADIFKSLTNFPKMLLGAVNNFFDAAFDFVDNFADNLEKMIPDLIVKIVSRLPEIFVKLTRALILDIPVAIVKGLIKAIPALFKAIGDNIKNFFKGALPKIAIDEKSVANLVKNLTGVSSNIFSVENLTKNTSDLAAKIGDGIVNAARKAGDWLKQAWQYIYDKIVRPIIGLFENLWNWVNNSIFKPIIAGISFVWETLRSWLKPVFDLIASVWDNLKLWFQPVIQMLKDLWDTVRGWFEPIVNALSSVWESARSWFQAGIETLSAIFDVFRKAVEALSKVSLGGITGGSDGKIGGTLGQIGEGAKKVFKNLGFSEGGPVYAADGLFRPKGVDTIPAMVAPGEFIVSKRGVDSIGVPTLRAINGGKSGALNAMGGNITVNLSINIDAKTTMDQAYIRNTLVPTVQDELKRASLDGKFVISQRGIR